MRIITSTAHVFYFLFIFGLCSAAHAVPTGLLFESDNNLPSGEELLIRSFSSIDDIITFNPLPLSVSGGFSNVDIVGNFSTTGFYSVIDNDPPTAVPEPGSFLLMGIGLLSLSLIRKNKAAY